jgi:hypothetical protein
MGQDDLGGVLRLSSLGKFELDWPSVGAAGIIAQPRLHDRLVGFSM